MVTVYTRSHIHTPSIYSAIQPSIFGSSQQKKTEQSSQKIRFPSYILQLLFGDPEVFPAQQEYI